MELFVCVALAASSLVQNVLNFFLMLKMLAIFGTFYTVFIKLLNTAFNFLFDDHSILNGEEWFFCNVPKGQGACEVQLSYFILSVN